MNNETEKKEIREKIIALSEIINATIEIRKILFENKDWDKYNICNTVLAEKVNKKNVLYYQLQFLNFCN